MATSGGCKIEYGHFTCTKLNYSSVIQEFCLHHFAYLNNIIIYNTLYVVYWLYYYINMPSRGDASHPLFSHPLSAICYQWQLANGEFVNMMLIFRRDLYRQFFFWKFTYTRYAEKKIKFSFFVLLNLGLLLVLCIGTYILRICQMLTILKRYLSLSRQIFFFNIPIPLSSSLLHLHCLPTCNV